MDSFNFVNIFSYLYFIIVFLRTHIAKVDYVVSLCLLSEVCCMLILINYLYSEIRESGSQTGCGLNARVVRKGI
jgi:hypothetical protein